MFQRHDRCASWNQLFSIQLRQSASVHLTPPSFPPRHVECEYLSIIGRWVGSRENGKLLLGLATHSNGVIGARLFRSDLSTATVFALRCHTQFFPPKERACHSGPLKLSMALALRPAARLARPWVAMAPLPLYHSQRLFSYSARRSAAQGSRFASPRPNSALPSFSPLLVRSYATENTIPVPGMGDSITEGTVLEWVVAEGQECKADDVVVVLETDKVRCLPRFTFIPYLFDCIHSPVARFLLCSSPMKEMLNSPLYPRLSLLIVL